MKKQNGRWWWRHDHWRQLHTALGARECAREILVTTRTTKRYAGHHRRGIISRQRRAAVITKAGVGIADRRMTVRTVHIDNTTLWADFTLQMYKTNFRVPTPPDRLSRNRLSDEARRLMKLVIRKFFIKRKHQSTSNRTKVLG